MISVILVIVGLSLLILVHELGHFLAAKWIGVGVEEFSIGFPPRMISKKIGGTRYSINWLPLGGFVKLAGEYDGEFVKKKIWQRAVVLVAGVVMNFLAGWSLLMGVFMIGVPTTILVHDVLPDSPAMIAGIEPGDRVSGFASAKEFVDFVSTRNGEEITITLERLNTDNQLEARTVKVVPNKTIGVLLNDAGVPAQPWWRAIGGAFIQSWYVLWSILIALGSIFHAPQAFVGPIGIFNIAIETGRLGIVYTLHLLAIISLNLVVLNLLPIPALDGGRLLFLLIEKIRRVPFSQKRELFWNSIGFVFLMLLLVVVTAADVVRMW